LTLPEGNFVITAKAQFDLSGEVSAIVDCMLRLEPGGLVIDQSAVQLSSTGAVATLPLSGVAMLAPAGADAVLSCGGDNTDNVSASRVKLTAIQVETLSP
jgi:hypothetical protein